MEGKKNDQGKNRLELLPVLALEGLARVLTFGAQKYDDWNWAKGMKWSRLQGAALRHIFAFIRGENDDPESGLPHLDHAQCCISFLSQYQKAGLGTDDRFKQELKGAQGDLQQEHSGDRSGSTVEAEQPSRLSAPPTIWFHKGGLIKNE